MSTIGAIPRSSLPSALAVVVATLAAGVGGGLIHLKASIDHRNLLIVGRESPIWSPLPSPSFWWTVAIVGFSVDRWYQAVTMHLGRARSLKLIALVAALILTAAGLSHPHDQAHHLGLSGPPHGHDHHTAP